MYTNNECLNCEDSPNNECYECYLLNMSDEEYKKFVEDCEANDLRIKKGQSNEKKRDEEQTNSQGINQYQT